MLTTMSEEAQPLDEVHSVAFCFKTAEAADRFQAWFLDGSGEQDWLEFCDVHGIDPALKILGMVVA